MFPITHIWFSEKVLGVRNSLSVLGAVFPDIAIAKCLNRDQTHNCTWRLYDYLVKECSGCEDFARALVTHTVDPRGLDYYGDESFGTGNKGYCFQKAEAITVEVIEACNIPQEFGLWKAHNFIEMGIEANIAAADRTLTGSLYDALNDMRAIKKLAGCLESYYSLEKDALVAGIGYFSDFIVLEETNSHTLACKYDIQMQAKHGISINIEAASRIIDKCRLLVEADYDIFIEYCTEKISGMIEVKDNE